MAKIEFTLIAYSDLNDIVEYMISDYATPLTIKTYILKIEKSINSLSEFPEKRSLPLIKSIRDQGYRFLIVGSHLIFYKFNSILNKITIYRILHQKSSYDKIL